MRRSALLALAASALILVGCSSTSTTSTGDGTTTTTQAKVAKAVVIEKGDKICKDADAEVGDQPKSESEADVKAYLVKGVKSNRASIVAIKAIGVPDSDADKLTEALDAQSSALDLLEKKIDTFAKDPSTLASDTEVTAAVAKSKAAAQAFGFKECGKSSDSSSSGSGSDKTTTTTSSGTTSKVDATAMAKAFLAGISPNETYTSDQISCLATNVFSDSDLTAISQASTATVAEKTRLFSTMVDCIGPTFLIDLFMQGASTGKTDAQIACIKGDLTALSKDEGLALVAGDPDAAQSFAQKIAADCG